jgi:hypothetical protein
MKEQRYFFEVNKGEVKLLRNMCDTYYKIAKENWSLRLMLDSSKMGKRLDSLINKNIKI